MDQAPDVSASYDVGFALEGVQFAPQLCQSGLLGEPLEEPLEAVEALRRDPQEELLVRARHG